MKSNQNNSKENYTQLVDYSSSSQPSQKKSFNRWGIIAGIIASMAVGGYMLSNNILHQEKEEKTPLYDEPQVLAEETTTKDYEIQCNSDIKYESINNVDFSEGYSSTQNSSKYKTTKRTIPSPLSVITPKVRKPIPAPSINEDSIIVAENDSICDSIPESENQFIWLSQQQFTEDDFNKMNPDRETLRIWRNAIFASHGYIFKNKDLYKYFRQYSWYNPTTFNVENQLSEIEKENARILRNMYEDAAQRS